MDVRTRQRVALTVALVGFILLALVLVWVTATGSHDLTGAGPSATASTSTTAKRRTTTLPPWSEGSRSESDESTETTEPGSSANPEAGRADPNFFVSWLPQLQTAAAPDWVEQGVRITYYAQAASVPNSYHQYVEDENGGWINPETGKRYRQEDIAGAAGHGYNQVTVTSLTDTLAALSIHAYGLTEIPLDSPVTTLTWGGAVGLPGAGSDYWLNPDVLADVEEVVSENLKVVRMPYTTGGESYRALWIQSLSDDGNYTWVYDLDSGMLLHTGSATQGPPLVGPVAQGEGREGSTYLTQTMLVNVRQPGLPWADDPAPGWVIDTTHLDYTGQFSVNIAGSVTNLDLSLAIDRRDVGTDWARYLFSQTTYSNVAPSVTEYMQRIDGSGQVGGIWIPTNHLDELQVGQVLDVDPETQITVSVAAIEPTASGFTVTIRQEGAREVSEMVYDGQTGLLLSSVGSDVGLGTTVSFEFNGSS